MGHRTRRDFMRAGTAAAIATSCQHALTHAMADEIPRAPDRRVDEFSRFVGYERPLLSAKESFVCIPTAVLRLLRVALPDLLGRRGGTA